MNKKAIIMAAATALCAVAVGIVAFLLAPRRLKLIDVETGKLYLSRQIAEGDGFSVSFTHSVNRSEVEEGYIVKNGKLYLDWCRYYAFGAGVATEIGEGQTLSYLEDGSMLIEGFNMELNNLVYSIATIEDNYLIINGEKISLQALGAGRRSVSFTISR